MKQRDEVEETVKEEVEEAINEETRRFTATFYLTNSKKVGFTRRDLALCFYPPQVVEKADRNYEVIKVDGRILPFDNPSLVRRIWEIAQKKYIIDGTVKKSTRHSFDWAKVVRRLLRDFNLESFYAHPGRHKIISTIKITTGTASQFEHTQTVEKLYAMMRKNAPHLTLTKLCTYNVEGTCPLNVD